MFFEKDVCIKTLTFQELKQELEMRKEYNEIYRKNVVVTDKKKAVEILAPNEVQEILKQLSC